MKVPDFKAIGLTQEAGETAEGSPSIRAEVQGPALTMPSVPGH